MQVTEYPPRTREGVTRSRRQVLAGGAGFAAALAAAGSAAAAESAPGTADFLFVQTAREMAFDADLNRLTLRGVSPVTLYLRRSAGADRRQHVDNEVRTFLE